MWECAYFVDEYVYFGMYIYTYMHTLVSYFGCAYLCIFVCIHIYAFSVCSNQLAARFVYLSAKKHLLSR